MSSTRSNFSILFCISRTKVNKQGEVPVLMKININGDRAVVNLKRTVKPDEWNSSTGRQYGNSKAAKQLNELIDTLQFKARSKYNDLLNETDLVSAAMLRDALLGINSGKSRDIIEIWNDHLEEMRSLIGNGVSSATVQKYGSALRHFKRFILLKYRTRQMSAKAIDPDFIVKFSNYLKSQAGCSHNTTVKFMQTFRAIVNICIRNAWITKDPYVGFQMKLKIVDRAYLTEQELEVLAEFESDIDRLTRIRDFFLFSCYTGLAYIDIKNLRKRDIAPSPSETGLWIRTRRQKTGVVTNVPLLGLPLEIINRYGSLDKMRSDDPVLPIPSNQKMNAYLKELADLCGIEKELTFHIARHTFATTVTLMNGVPIESVSKMLGHTNLKSTQHYAKVVDKKLGDDMAALAMKLSMKKSVMAESAPAPTRRAKRTPVNR
jgi:site-specific recombinase XerD